MIEEITKISSKGQVVIPSKIREALQLDEGSRLVVTTLNNMIILKKLKMESLKEEFKKLTKDGESFAQKRRIINEEDVLKRIHKGRGLKGE